MVGAQQTLRTPAILSESTPEREDEHHLARVPEQLVSTAVAPLTRASSALGGAACAGLRQQPAASALNPSEELSIAANVNFVKITI